MWAMDMGRAIVSPVQWNVFSEHEKSNASILTDSAVKMVRKDRLVAYTKKREC